MDIYKRKFFACSVGQPGMGYDEENLERIQTNSAFILHQDTNQKGVYNEIDNGDILLLKFRGRFIAFGEALGIRSSADAEWNLLAPVRKWHFMDSSLLSAGVPIYGIGYNTQGGGPYGTVKEIKPAFAIDKLKDLDPTAELYKSLLKEIIKNKELKIMVENIELLLFKKQIILQGPPGTGKTKMAEEIADTMISSNEGYDESFSYKVNKLTREFIQQHLKQGDVIQSKNNTNLTVVKMDDNVIRIKSDISQIWSPSYNKIINSYENGLWQLKGRSGGFTSYENAVAKYFHEKFSGQMEEVTVEERQDKAYKKIIQFHPSFSYEDFVRGIVARPNPEGDGILYDAENRIFGDFAKTAMLDPANKYVLIIDEINRANLSSVLGELIYALEYRDRELESMYESEGSNAITVPSNLYIIGTMNTADRSVGHIDYAIRRRFAFVDILPRDLSESLGEDFNKALFDEVAALFTFKYLSPEFRASEVQLGHSYFIKHFEKDLSGKKNPAKPYNFQLRIKYEILPILREYLRDGVFNEAAEKELEALEKKYLN
jgi:5-methylcytosine-specific restriction protein B